jgi:hypothetical protein
MGCLANDGFMVIVNEKGAFVLWAVFLNFLLSRQGWDIWGE